MAPLQPGFSRSSLRLNSSLARNRWNLFFTVLAAVFAAIAVLPLVLVLGYVLVTGFFSVLVIQPELLVAVVYRISDFLSLLVSQIEVIF